MSTMIAAADPREGATEAGAGPTAARKSGQALQESDSGLEQTSSSSSSASSSASNCSAEDETASTSTDDNNQTDCFVDASEELHTSGRVHGAAGAPTGAPTDCGPNSGGHAERASLKVRLEETTQVLRLALSNEFIKALDSCEDRAKSELYASLAHATLSFLRAALTLERADLRAALASINQSFEVSQLQRRQVSAASMVMRLLYKPNYNAYTDDECHAELVNAEAMLLLSLISFLADQSVLCLVRGAFRIRACHQRYKECLYILDSRTAWASAEARAHFESGVRMGHGIFNLLMSYLPRRVLKFLEYVGFSGSRTIGTGELDKSIELADGLRSVFSALVILTYHSYVENIFGLGHYDELKVAQLNDTFLGHYPNSAFFLLFLGRHHQMQGRLAKAIESFELCCQVQQDWKQFHSLCHWEIMWCYACQMDWKRAAHYARLLGQNSKWSPASYQYQYGTFLYAQLIQEQREGLLEEGSGEFAGRMEEIRSIIEKVPSMRVRFAGKTIPADKFAITRSLKFCQPNCRLSLPSLEFLYIWNIFSTMRNSPRQVERLLACIASEIGHINKWIEQSIGQEQFGGGGGDGQLSPDKCVAGQVDTHETGGAQIEEADGANDEECAAHRLAQQPQQPPQQMAWIDNLCLMYLLEGICLKHLGRPEEAEQSFTRVIAHEHQIVADKFLVPHSAMELALLNLQLKQYETARQWIKRARHNYTGYLMETIVHFRLHAASRIIRLEQRRQSTGEDSPDQSPCPSPGGSSLGRRLQ